MVVLCYIFGSLLILVSIALTVLVMMQEQKGKGLSGAIGGDMGANFAERVRGTDALLAKWTKVFGVAFAVLVVLVSLFAMLK